MKQHRAISILIAMGAAFVLYLLWKENQPLAGTEEIPGAPVGTTGQDYPALAPLDFSAGDVAGSAAEGQLYNTALTNPVTGDGGNTFDPFTLGPAPAITIPNLGATGGGGCSCDDCEAAGQPVTVSNIPWAVFQGATQNLQSFAYKLAP
jgi:hypothetical protein